MPPKPLILFVTSEIYPFSKTGGLGDVMGALPLTLHRQGVNTAVVTPLYGRLRTAGHQLHLLHSELPVGYPWAPVTTDVYVADFHGMPVYFIHRDEYFDRRYYYNTYKGDYFDNCERFIFFCRAVVEWMKQLEERPAVINANDWQSALTTAYVYFLRQADPAWSYTRTVLTIHNLAFQGRFSARLFWDSGLPPHAFTPGGAEYYGDFNLLKAGIAYADMVTTVSPSYAEEIVISPEYGAGLEGILASRKSNLAGVVNGADYDVWDPAKDKFLPAVYDVDNLEGKRECKMELIKEMGLNPFLENRPILGFIGRLREQKGIDLLLQIMEQLMDLDVGIVVLGEGSMEYEQELMNIMEDFPLRIGASVSYTEDLAHRIQAGCDIFLMPSRYEPCGLTQMYALRFGTPPVATAVGGLRDTIIPWPDPQATGFVFENAEPEPFFQAVKNAVDLWQDDHEEWSNLQRRGMLQDFSWNNAARSYLNIYRRIGAIV